ncbi:MAG TPA: glycosyltransferase family 4 protein, partial [Nitrospirota bacterium]|nr:glycosyltransferase family 4 protein [Nitrospirota bacterium]
TASHEAYKYLPRLRAAFGDVRVMDILHFDSKSSTMDLMLVDPHPYLDRRVCISHNLKELMIKKYTKAGISPEYTTRLLVIHNGIDIKAYISNGRTRGAFRSHYGVPADSKVISFIGRFVDQKKPLLFVEIAAAVMEKIQGAKIHFVMAGDGPEFEKVRAAVDRHGLAGHVTLTGSLSNVPDLLAETDLLLVTSAYEGIPLAVTEAMAMNVPVISTDVDAVGELIENNRNGFLIDPENNVVESFTAKIADLLTGKCDHHVITDRARKTVTGEYSLETMGARYQKVFDDLLSARTLGPS